MDADSGTAPEQKTKTDWRQWGARLCIAVVVAWNLAAALTFWLAPGVYAPGFELGGVPGEVAVRGVAVLFLMWNIPYLFALAAPRRNAVSLVEAILMQLIGVAGEYLILAGVAADHGILRGALLRFILFDSTGLGLLAIAFVLTRI